MFPAGTNIVDMTTIVTVTTIMDVTTTTVVTTIVDVTAIMVMTTVMDMGRPTRDTRTGRTGGHMVTRTTTIGTDVTGCPTPDRGAKTRDINLTNVTGNV